jgi:tetratricopeptide (TPR) repeat protein
VARKAEHKQRAGGYASGVPGLLARPSADPPQRGQSPAQAADAALTQGDVGKHTLPVELHADFDRIVQAFAQVHAGQDEAARETLQGIGLRSPFLEWKVLLRGLMAYYQHDDVRALDNWQRLAADRLPAHLAAPFRSLIDQAYREAQAPQAQAVLRQQADRLQADHLVGQLRAIQATLSDARSLNNAFNLAMRLLPGMRQGSPHLAARLASCFYWAIITTGTPDDVPRYSRVFGPPPDDPAFARLRALAYEAAHELEQAHKEWQKFEKSVAAHPAAWPAGQAERVRALTWSHMGTNAAAVPDLEGLPLPDFLRDHPARPRPLKPSAEQCFEQSLKLAPDVQETHENLVELYRDQRKLKKAEAAARRLLERFPDHVPTLVTLGDLRMGSGEYAEGIALFERAVQHNPLDRSLRKRLSTAHTFRARDHAESARFEDARAEYRAALALAERSDNSSVYCKWAACEFRARDAARAEELLGQALAKAGSRLAVAYSMLIEVIRLRLTPQKKRFNDEFNDLLGGPADGASAAAVAETAASHMAAGITYHGQKTHEKKVLNYLQKAVSTPMTEDQLERICAALVSLQQHRLLKEYAWHGHKRHPKNPYFVYFQAEACRPHTVYGRTAFQFRELLEEARRLAQALPPEPRRDALLEQIRHREEMAGAMGAPDGLDFGAFSEAIESLFFSDDEDEGS